jgi:hypothetical protein
MILKKPICKADAGRRKIDIVGRIARRSIIE